jgi:putative MATE family efflux protein
MDAKEHSERRFRKMTETPVQKLILELAVPPIISMLISSVYNMADTYFVSRISTSASGAVGVVFSLMAIIQAIGFTLGMGAGTYASRLLGERNHEAASRAASTSFFASLIVGGLIAAYGLLFTDTLMGQLGATPTILPYARAYGQYILIGAPYMAASFVMNNVLRAQGSAFYGMLGIGVGGLLNILLDPLFIFAFDMGIAGAAIATILSQLVSFLVLLYFCMKDLGGVQIRFKYFTFSRPLHYEILRNGLPSFYRQMLASLAAISLNLAAGPYGDAAIAAMSIVARYCFFMVAAMLGFGQGFMPVCGFNYGARRYDRVWTAFWFSLKVAVTVFILLSTVSFLFATPILTFFRKEDLEVVRIGALALRFQCIVFPLQAWIIMTSMLTQSIGKTRQASLLSMGRQGIFFLPLIFFLPGFLGLTGVQIAQPLADLATLLMSIPLTVPVLKEIRRRMTEENFLGKEIPEV